MGLLKKLTTAGCWVLSLVLPVDKKKVVFCSYYGRGYSDNPKAIANEMLRSGTDAKLVWLVKNEKEAATLPEGIQPCPYDSPKRIWELATARVWVDNCRKYDRFKKKGQYYLQTWHGFPFKRIEKDAVDSLPSDYERGALRDSKHTDLLLSNSAFDTEVLRRSFWYEGEIAEYGYPRNDVFIYPETETYLKVRTLLSLPSDRKIILYAPTFRADHSIDAYCLDAERLHDACCRRFDGEWTVLIRLHPNVAEQSVKLFAYDGNTIVDATMYPDMQELLCASEILITDYSSSMFDFALSGKPCMRFALDVECYTKDRNFYFPINGLPFPLAETNDEMIALIENFDEAEYSRFRDKFYSELSFCEDGKASERCVKWINEKLG